MQWEWITVVLQLIFIEGLLSIDNAAVLGAMVSHLPRDEAIPWPRRFSGLARRLDPLLGFQQQAALKVGLLGAYLGRGIMLFLASLVLRNLWLRVLGGLYLIYLALDHLTQPLAEAEAGLTPESSPSGGAGFWRVVGMVELTDLAFSLDNVVAAVALSEHILVLLLGVAIGILAMRLAAGQFTRLVQREPILEPAAYVLVLWIGLLFVLEELLHFELGAPLQFGVSVAILGSALLYAHWAPLRRISPYVRAGREAIVAVRARNGRQSSRSH